MFRFRSRLGTETSSAITSVPRFTSILTGPLQLTPRYVILRFAVQKFGTTRTMIHQHPVKSILFLTKADVGKREASRRRGQREPAMPPISAGTVRMRHHLLALCIDRHGNLDLPNGGRGVNSIIIGVGPPSTSSHFTIQTALQGDRCIGMQLQTSTATSRERSVAPFVCSSSSTD